MKLAGDVINGHNTKLFHLLNPNKRVVNILMNYDLYNIFKSCMYIALYALL